eukprot:2537175-Prymnesium_polylepis.1
MKRPPRVRSRARSTIVSLTTGLFPPTQQIIGCCVIPVMQHWFVLLRYHSRAAYTLIELSLEVAFQIEVRATVCHTGTHLEQCRQWDTQRHWSPPWRNRRYTPTRAQG